MYLVFTKRCISYVLEQKKKPVSHFVGLKFGGQCWVNVNVFNFREEAELKK